MTLLACAGFAAVALAGCSSDVPAANSTPAAPTSEASLIPQTGPAPTKPGASPQAGCPVDAASLEKAFKANTKLSVDIVLGKGLKDISCAQDFATAITQPDNVDPAVVLFQYEQARKQWIAITGGTSGVCTGKVPVAVMKQLKHCDA